jgi:hypothetical protein
MCNSLENVNMCSEKHGSLFFLKQKNIDRHGRRPFLCFCINCSAPVLCYNIKKCFWKMGICLNKKDGSLVLYKLKNVNRYGPRPILCICVLYLYCRASVLCENKKVYLENGICWKKKRLRSFL